MGNLRIVIQFRHLGAPRFCSLIVPALVCALLFLSGCARKPTLPDYWPTAQWRHATPESQGIDSNTLAEALRLVHDKKLPLHSLLIARRGHVVIDEYFYPFADGLRHDVASVTKSVTATLVGMAIEDGHIPELESPALAFFSDRTIQNMDSRKARMSIGHLLSMSSGFQCGYQASERELFDMRATRDWIQFTLDLPMHSAPGTEFAYCSSGMHLLSGIVTQATGKSLEDYAASRLFKPLGIKDWHWPADPAGNSNGWGDLQLHPRDMAKIGLLYLYQGQWDGQQLISPEWVKQATRTQIDVAGKGVSYGYGWWLSELAGTALFQARGRGGQRIVIWPEKDIVVALTAGGLNTDELAGYLAQAVRSDDALPENPQAVATLNESTAALKLAPSAQPVPPPPPIAAQVSGTWYRLQQNPLGLEAVMITVGDQKMDFGIRIDGRRYTLPVGLDGVYRLSNETPSELPAGVRAHWRSEDTLVLEYDEISRVNHFTLTIQFMVNSIDVEITEPTGLYHLNLHGTEVG